MDSWFHVDDEIVMQGALFLGRRKSQNLQHEMSILLSPFTLTLMLQLTINQHLWAFSPTRTTASSYDMVHD